MAFNLVGTDVSVGTGVQSHSLREVGRSVKVLQNCLTGTLVGVHLSVALTHNVPGLTL